MVHHMYFKVNDSYASLFRTTWPISKIQRKQNICLTKRSNYNNPILCFISILFFYNVWILERDHRKRRVDPDDDPPGPNLLPEELDDRVYNPTFNRKSKLATLLTPDYKVYKNLFRKVAEEFTIARRDAMNFVLFMVIQWFNTRCVELYAYQSQHAPQIQRSLQKILHETLLMNQLRDLLQQATNLLQQEQTIPNQYENLLDLRAQIQNYFTEILPTSQRLNELLIDLNNNINNQEGQLEYEQQRIAQDNLSLHTLRFRKEQGI